MPWAATRIWRAIRSGSSSILPTGIYTDVIAMWNSMALIDAKALFKKDHVLPGHDSKVFKQAYYPK
jgi:hypothetical protein